MYSNSVNAENYNPDANTDMVHDGSCEYDLIGAGMSGDLSKHMNSGTNQLLQIMIPATDSNTSIIKF